MAERSWKHDGVCWTVLVTLLAIGAVKAQGPVEYPGPAPGAAKASISGNRIMLANNALECTWFMENGHLRLSVFTNKEKRVPSTPDSECFRLLLVDGQTLKASDLKNVSVPEIDNLQADPKARRLSARVAGKQIRMILATPDDNLTVQWRVELRDGSNYVRQFISLTLTKTDVDVREVVLVQTLGKSAGTLDGAPLTVIDRYFFAFEHPLAKTRTVNSRLPLNSVLQSSLPRSTPLKVGEEQTLSSVMGVAPEGQLRRAFLYYLERERVQPYRPFLHYNSWYDIGYGSEKILEPEALKVIDLFGQELIEKRKVALASFVPDDGWDDPATLWRFHEGFPRGFATLQERAERYNSSIGVWLSPWGGYGEAKKQRMKYGLEQGFETNKNGFSLAGPKYYERFRDACLGMVRDYRVNYFKFDGISSGGVPTGAPPESAADVEALLRLIGDLRRAKPDLFINVTTGTWSSPYWLWYADSTWRSGRDWGTCGWGSKRQQQVTYRDAQTYQNVVRRAPLYPINSLMTQGVMFANHGLPDDTDRIVEDIRAFFAGGTNCQELYLTPSLLDAKTWDALAEAALWSRANADVLVDTHWLGGDPAQGDIYGWASWSRRKGILALRNPKDGPGKIALDIGQAFELPEGAAKQYSLKSPWKEDAAKPARTLSAGAEHTFELKPFEVLVFDALP
ncbi:MAG: enterotoxin [Planctomycetes bacterium]|nr:enterotoxin [Planctomycetota bacterium]